MRILYDESANCKAKRKLRGTNFVDGGLKLGRKRVRVDKL